MSWIKITQNGDKPLSIDKGSLQTTVSVLAPATMNGATVVISYVDETGTTNPLTDGSLVDGGQAYVRAGASLPLVATVTGFVSPFSIFVSLSRD